MVILPTPNTTLSSFPVGSKINICLNVIYMNEQSITKMTHPPRVWTCDLIIQFGQSHGLLEGERVSEEELARTRTEGTNLLGTARRLAPRLLPVSCL